MARKKKEEESKAGLPALVGAGMELLGPEDLVIPRIVLVQPISQIDGVEQGKFFMNLTSEQFDEVEAVFLKVTKGRVYFADPSDRKPLCGSTDRVKPSPRFDPPMAPTCVECHCSRWNGKDPSLCNETYNLLGVMVATEIPFWWSVKSTAIAPTKRFISAVALRARTGKSLFDAKVAMKSQLVTLPGKKYYMPVYTVEWLRDSSLYRDLYTKYSHEEIDRTFAEEEATAGDKDFDWQTGEEKKGGVA